MQNETVYTFTTSQPLTKQQLNYLNRCLEELPFSDTVDQLDVPEYTTEIVEA